MNKELIVKGMHNEHRFELVDKIPTGYQIWNIGSNMTEGYLPLVQTGGYDGCQVNVDTIKAIKVDEAQVILRAIGGGQKTLKKMEQYIKRYSKSKNAYTKNRVNRLIEAVRVMKTISGVENLI